MPPKRKRGTPTGRVVGAGNPDRDAYIDLRMQQNPNPLRPKTANAAARKHYQGQFYRIGKDAADEEERLDARAEALRVLRQEVEGAGASDEAGDGVGASGNEADGEETEAGKATRRPGRRRKKARSGDSGKGDIIEQRDLGAGSSQEIGKVGANSAPKKGAPQKKKLVLKNTRKYATGADADAAGHLIADGGDGNVPAVAPKGARRPNAAQQAKDAEEAAANNPNGVTRGGDVPDMDTAKKTAAGGEVLNDIYPPFEPADGEWEMGWEKDGRHLGTGGQGCVFLYRRFQNDQLAERVVVKDSMLSGAEWSCFYKWHPNVQDLDNRIPMEVHCLETLRDSTADGADTCITIRGSRLENSSMWYRLYTGWCQHDILFSLFTGERTERHKGADVPEPALWSIFNDLVRSCLVLDTGGVDKPAKDWTPMVHRDLKLANVFLDARPAESNFSSYPKAVFGDFGMAIMTEADKDPHNPFAYSQPSEGTPRWRAPEQVLFRSQRTLLPSDKHNWKLSSATNVWGLGAIMIRLMNRGAETPPGDKFCLRYEHGKEEVPVLLPGAKKAFSKDLRELALKCCAFEPAERPTLRELRKTREGLTNADAEEQSPGLNQGMRWEKHAEGDEALRLRYKDVPEGYAIEMVRD